MAIYWGQNQQIKTIALIQAVELWKDGLTNYVKPAEEEANKVLTYLHTFLDSSFEMTDFEVEVCQQLNLLLSYNVMGHFHKVASHRRWVKLAYELLLNTKIASLHDGLKERVEDHDISKYGPYEALGFTIMFGYNNIIKELPGWEKEEWEKSLSHHYMANKHHPQRSQYIEEEMTELDLQESLLDMMACRFERELQKCNGIISYTALLSFVEHYFNRYNTSQKNYIHDFIKLALWGLHEIIATPTDEQKARHEDWKKESGLNIGCFTCNALNT